MKRLDELIAEQGQMRIERVTETALLFDKWQWTEYFTQKTNPTVEDAIFKSVIQKEIQYDKSTI